MGDTCALPSDIRSCLSGIQKSFFSVSDLKSWKWFDIIKEFDVDYDTCQHIQELLLASTVKHSLILKYPVKVSYQQHFLKKFISLLEERGLEVSENLYNCYLQLFKQSDSEASSHYRHFLLPINRFVTLCERTTFISDGTTGLCSWQGSFALSEWLIKNQEELANKTVLELGSGTGLAGLILLAVGKPDRYYFSDCHPEVLKQLRSNVILNTENGSDRHPKLEGEILNENHVSNEKDNEFIYWETKYNGIDVKVLNLPWESVDDGDLTDVKPDIVIASDVVYDDSLFTPLCDTLEYFLRNKNAYAFLVCTIRNEFTFNNFCQLLEMRKFVATEVDPVLPCHLPYSLDTPIKFLKIQVEDVS